jgi:hypothetical protein
MVRIRANDGFVAAHGRLDSVRIVKFEHTKSKAIKRVIMERKLKTYPTSLGFFDLAIAPKH